MMGYNDCRPARYLLELHRTVPDDHVGWLTPAFGSLQRALVATGADSNKSLALSLAAAAVGSGQDSVAGLFPWACVLGGGGDYRGTWLPPSSLAFVPVGALPASGV